MPEITPAEEAREVSAFSIKYLPVNQAWVAMFGESILAGPVPYDEAVEYFRTIGLAPDGTPKA